MEGFRARGLISLIALSLIVPCPAGVAAPAGDLEGIKKKIETEKKGLSELKAKEGSVLQSLGKIESEIGKRSRELKAANAKLVALSQQMATKQVEAENLEHTIALRQEVLRKRAVALYRWQRSAGSWKIITTAESLGNFLQRKHYLQVALAFDQEMVGQLHAEQQRHEQVRQELAAKKTELDSHKLVLDAAKEAVRQEAQRKKVLLVSLRLEKESRTRALREMEAAALRLQKMLDEISRRALVKPRESPPAASSGFGLDALRGQLDWPVKGEVSAPFGKFKHPEFAAEVIRKGIDIDAPMGEAIRAVEKGRVVYAKRFTGYGNMVIVDHGERYYTIYGHLAEILKKNGDQVSRGEVLGRVGDSDSNGGPKLYFEMRKDGRSVDPLAWLKKQ